MKKRLFTIIFSLLICSLSAIGFVACNSGNDGGSSGPIDEECSHTYSDWAVKTAATCTEKGEETRACTKCGDEQTQEIAALGHEYSDWTVKTAATCTEKGEETRACTKCGDEQTQEIAALGHEYSDWAVTDESGHCHACTRENCDKKTTDDEIDENNDYACDICGESLLAKLKADLSALVGDGTNDSVTVTLNLNKNADAAVFAAIVECLASAKDGSVNLTISGAETIPEQAFLENAKLKSITFGEGVKTIGAASLVYCASLEAVTFGKDLETIGSQAFYMNPKLKSIIIPDNVTSLGESAFYACEALDSVSIGSGIGVISEQAFVGCESLKSITIPSTITAIDAFAFASTGLTSIVLPDTVTTLGKGAFQQCEELASVTLSANITTIPTQLFYACETLTSISLPSKITSIGESAFEKSGLTEIVIPSKVTEIGAEAFRGCAFSNVTIPSSVTKIGNEAFYMCKSLTEIVVPDSVTELGYEVLGCCTALKKVTIGSGISSIGKIFTFCTSLESVTFRAPITYFNSVTFSYCTPENITLIFAEGQKKLTEKEDYPGEYELEDGADDFTSGTEFCGFTFKNIILLDIDTSAMTTEQIKAAVKTAVENGVIDLTIKFASDADGNAFNAVCQAIQFSNWEECLNLTITGVTGISTTVFYNYSWLKSITFGDGITTLGGEYPVINFCGSFECATIGKSVKTIGGTVFYDCASLEKIVYEGTVAEWNAITKVENWVKDCPLVTEVVCSDGVATLN